MVSKNLSHILMFTLPRLTVAFVYYYYFFFYYILPNSHILLFPCFYFFLLHFFVLFLLHLCYSPSLFFSKTTLHHFVAFYFQFNLARVGAITRSWTISRMGGKIFVLRFVPCWSFHIWSNDFLNLFLCVMQVWLLWNPLFRQSFDNERFSEKLRALEIICSFGVKDRML